MVIDLTIMFEFCRTRLFWVSGEAPGNESHKLCFRYLIDVDEES